MSVFDEKNKGRQLPPMPGALAKEPEKKKPEIEGVPFIIYLNGKPIEMSRQEALAVMAQIVNILIYLDGQQAMEKEPENKKE